MSIKDNWLDFLCKVEYHADHFGRKASDIHIMSVSKTRSVEEIREGRAAGMTIFGENRVDEASEKFALLDQNDFPLYFIGHLQSNKVRHIGGRFAGVHSVHSLSLAQKLSAYRKDIGADLEILLQVNTSGEASKSGFNDRSEFLDTAQQIAELPFLCIKGLMTMAPFVDDEKIVRQCFSLCREWGSDMKKLVDGSFVLSMGMSSDYHWAIAEGSNLLRIGTVLFGER